MAVLTDSDRADLSATIQRTLDCPGALSKAQLRAVFNAIDDWWETTGSAAANTAIPLPQRNMLTAKQKARIFTLILERRYEVT